MKKLYSSKFTIQKMYLENISLNGLHNLESIGDLWMSKCFNLNKPDFTVLRQIKSVGNYAMFEFNVVKKFDFIKELL